MGSDSVDGFAYQSIMTYPFQKSIDLLRPPPSRKAVYECLRILASGHWDALGVDRTFSPVLTLSIDSNLTVVFELLEVRPRNILCYYDVCNPERAREVIEGVILAKAKSQSPLPRSTGAFSKIIPDWALQSERGLEEILTLDKAGLLLTKEQEAILHIEPPLIINGAAGSGKTLLLCYRLADSIHNGGESRNRLAFLSYNSRLVERARQDTGEVLRGRFRSTRGLEGVNFSPMREFLLSYVKDQGRYKSENYISFGRFKEHFENFGRGDATVRGVSSEKAWHGIRSLLKGACLPPIYPPLSKLEYERLARSRKEFSYDEFDTVYRIGEWYQKQLIEEKGLWDDQDLAWDALKSIIEAKTFSTNFALYDQIFCDEAQDLTQLEFRTLMELCKPPLESEGFQIVMAGDPLQTINPTGFRWNIVRNEIFRVLHGSVVQFRELGENFRSDKRIVDFANEVQDIRGIYLDQPITPQEGFVEEGEMPQVITLASASDAETIRRKLGELPPESAVIVWPEEKDQVSLLCDTEQALGMVDRQLDLYSVSEAKGLEFRLVVLYKIGSSTDAMSHRSYLGLKQMTKQKPSIKDEISLLYFLNRLYVALTRAKLYLVIVDTQEGLDRFWSLWKDFLDVVPQDKTRVIAEGSPAFQGDFSETKWRRWGQTLLDHAEETLDVRNFERARRAFEKAGEEGKVKWIEARIEELNGSISEAGQLYFEINDFMRSASCFEKSGDWASAYKALEKLPTTREVSRRMAVCKFKRDRASEKEKAAREFYAYFRYDEVIERDFLVELADALIQFDSHAAGDVLESVGSRYKDASSLAKAAEIRYNEGKFEKAVDLYKRSGNTSSKEYNLSLAEKSNADKDYGGAIELLFTLGEHKRVIQIYEKAIEAKWIPGDIRGTVAKSYALEGNPDAAMLIYEELSADLVRRGQWVKAIACISPDLFYRDRRIENYCRIISAAVESRKTFSEVEKEQLIGAARNVVAVPYWEFRIKPEVMGVIFSQCGTVTEKVDFYRQFLNESWTYPVYLAALGDLATFQHQNSDEIGARRTESEIKEFKKQKGLR